MRLSHLAMASWTVLCGAALFSCGGDDSTNAGDAGGDDGGMLPDSAPPADGGADAPPDTGPPIGASVLQYHLNASRDGHYVDPLMTKAAAAKLQLDPTFDGTVIGPVWGQPLYVENGPGGKGILIVTSNSNDVYALDETTGMPVWHKNMGMPADNTQVCGNVHPIGVNGTAVVDLGSRTLYLNSGIGDANNALANHVIRGLSIDDGSDRFPGVTVNLTSPQGVKFGAVYQNQRGGLALQNGYLYVPYGGHAGDCGDYHGWVVSLPVSNPTNLSGYSTPAVLGGMWAVGGLSSDGTDVFVVSGNTSGTGLPDGAVVWGGGEAVLRFHDGTALDATNTANFFYPSDWKHLDDGDIDVGGTGSLVVDVPGATPSKLIVALGKNGVMYLLDRTNLGGKGKGDGSAGEGIYSAPVAGSEIITAPAAYTTSTGTYVVFHARGGGTSCPKGMSGDLIAVKINPTTPPTFTTAWCQPTNGDASPIVTTTDPTSNPIVWVVGAEGTNLLYGWDGETGASIYNGAIAADGGAAPKMAGVLHFTTLIDVKGRLFVGASDKLYAFKSQ
jgi:hypothetical protein